jgi:peroxiredoxin
MILKRILPLLVVAVLSYLGWGIYAKANAKTETARRVARLPEVAFGGLDGQEVWSTTWQGKPLWIVFFRSDCQYCQMEADNIRKTGDALLPISIKLISPEPADTLRAFAARYGLDTLSNVEFLTDPNHNNYLTFGASTTPASFVYSPEGALIEKHSGVVKVESVLRAVGK